MRVENAEAVSAGDTDGTGATRREDTGPACRASDADVGDLDDVADLYGALSGRLEQIVRAVVRAPDAVVEDACQFAWSRLVYHGHRVRRETALGWLAKTAIHEALKLIRRRGREISLEAEFEDGDERAPISLVRGPSELVEQREQLEAIGRLPVRQQRALWLHALGLSYEEMAVYETCTTRTVERQLMRGRRTLRALTDE